MAAASGASARTTAPAHARAVRGAISLFRRSLPAALSTDLLPQTNGASPASSKGQVSINLFTNPVPLTIQGLTYQMTMAAYGQTNTFANPPQVEIGLERLVSKPGRGPVAAQQHSYGYASTGIQFSANSDVSKVPTEHRLDAVANRDQHDVHEERRHQQSVQARHRRARKRRIRAGCDDLERLLGAHGHHAVLR